MYAQLSVARGMRCARVIPIESSQQSSSSVSLPTTTVRVIAYIYDNRRSSREIAERRWQGKRMTTVSYKTLCTQTDARTHSRVPENDVNNRPV